MATNAPQPPSLTPPPRPYRDFLTPSLHRRFTNAALIALVACWLEAASMSDGGFFWSWFPLGPTGFRTLLLSISALAIFVLRISQLHFGPRTTQSPFYSLCQDASLRKLLQTMFWYQLSATLFAEVYIFSSPTSANLAWIDPGRSYERPRLNERPVLFRSLFSLLACAQSALHLYRDYDLVQAAPPPPPQQQQQNSGASSLIPQFQAAAAMVLQRSTTLVCVTTIAGPIIYYTLLRSLAWAAALSIGRSIFTLSKQVKPAGVTDATSLMFRFAWAALLLTSLWELSNYAFSRCMAREPLKKGSPLTADSKDPNGSLIAGLKAKKDLPRNMAFWELAIITSRFADRRATLYQDVDRRGGTTWSQVLNLCLAEIQTVSQRIQDHQHSPAPSAAAHTQSTQSAQTLPKVSQPLKQDNVFSPSRPASTALQLVQGGVSTLAKQYGSSPGSTAVGPKAQQLLEYGSHALLGEDGRQQLSRSNLSSQANTFLGRILQSPLGIPFRLSFHRRANAIIFGEPYSDFNVIVNAVRSLCGLVVCSLKEDTLGQVQRDIATIIRVLINTIQSVQNLVQSLPPHWTDVDFNGNRQVDEAEALLRVLRTGLAQILMTFGEYAGNLGLSRAEISLAKELVGSDQEMESVHTKM